MIFPITSKADLARATQERKRFLDAAKYVRSNPAPDGCGPKLWEAQAVACENLAVEIGAEIAAYRLTL